MSQRMTSLSLDFQGLSGLLSQCILDAEKSVQRMNLSNIRLMLFGCCLAEDQVQVEMRPRILPVSKPETVRIGCHKPETKKCRQFSADSCPSSHHSGHRWCAALTLTKSVRDLNASALNSGAVLYPGCKSRDNCPIVILCCQNEFWTSSNTAHISKVIEYFYHITRESVQSNGTALLVDARNVTERIEIVIAVISSLEVCVQKALKAVYFLVDSQTSDLFLTSLNLPSQVVAEVFTYENYDAVFEVFDKSQFPVKVGGSLSFCQNKWVEYRSMLESFILDCFLAANSLIVMTEEIIQTDDLPSSVRETETMLTRHDDTIKKTIENELLQKLCSTGKPSLECISKIEEEFSYSRDLCVSSDAADELFQRLLSSAVQIQFLAAERQQKLEVCLQLRQFEEQASQMINKLCADGEDLLLKYASTGDNLRSAKLQLQEFNRSYTQFQDQVAKGKEVIEESSVFACLGICDELTGIKEICHELRSCIASYTTRMDAVKQMLENTHNCYQVLDQSFEWALETIKFVVKMKLEKEMNLTEVERSKSQLEVFKNEHPPLPLEIFTQMERLLPSLNNQRLTEQWIKAKGHYVEIDVLIKQRYETLIKILNQLKHKSCDCNEGNSTETKTAKNPLTAAATELSKELKSQTDPNYSLVINGTDVWNISSVIPGADPNISNSPADTDSVRAHIDKHSGDSQVDLDTCIPHSGSQHDLIKHSSCDDDDVIPQLSPFEASDVTKPSDQYSSCANFSHSCDVVYHLSHSSSTSPLNVSRGSRPTSQAFDVSEYILKDNLSNVNPQISDIRPWFSQCTLPGPNCELVLQKSPSKCTYSSPFSLQESNLKNESLDRRLASLSSTASKSVPNTKPSWKSFRKVLRNFTDRDLNLRKHISRRSSSGFSPNAVDANSTESLPGRLRDEDEPVEPICLLSNEEKTNRRYCWSHVPSNSHMIFSNRLALASHSQSVIDIRLNDDEMQRNSVLSLIVRELTMTESDYIKSLKYVITNYIPELLSEDLTQTLHGKKNLIFGNIEKIYEFHSQIFLAKLQRCQNSPFQLGACFLKHESEFYLYALYNKNKPKADVLMEEFGHKYFQKKQRELNDQMDLNSYLLKPVQRLGKYALLLRQIIKECPQSHPDSQDLKAALEMVKFQLRHGNDLLAMDCLRDCDVNLQEQGVLLRQHEFLVFHGHKKCLRQVFLFEELVVFSKTKRSSSGHDMYIYKKSIKTSDLGLTESVGESGCRFELWFRKRTPGMTYILQSQLSDVKQQWVDDISQLLWKQTFRNRERRIAEMSCMGIGSKPSLDLEQSKDNIYDRFINICPSDRNRGRNLTLRPKSVALSSCYDGRRPHSLVSVSSVSSSGSSFSSGYGSYLSSAYGVTAGALATAEESPLEFIQDLSCEEMTSSHIEVKEIALECITALAGTNSMDDCHVMGLSASTSNDSGFIERGCIMVEDMSQAKLERTGFSGLMTEDAYTQTTLERPHKTLSIKATTPIASLELDSDDFY